MFNDQLLQRWITEFKKGYSKPLILVALAEVEKSYAYLLAKKISDLSKGEISIIGSNIYPMLSRLEEDELITSHLDDSKRKFYTLTEEGKEFLTQLEVAIQKFNSIMKEIINPYQSHGDT